MLALNTYIMKYVYESPDGGDTVYQREFGQVHRELYSISEKKRQQQQLETQWLMWRQILAASKDNPALQRALDQARVVYELSQHDH